MKFCLTHANANLDDRHSNEISALKEPVKGSALNLGFILGARIFKLLKSTFLKDLLQIINVG